jgi:hypothetical protein
MIIESIKTICLSRIELKEAISMYLASIDMQDLSTHVLENFIDVELGYHLSDSKFIIISVDGMVVDQLK